MANEQQPKSGLWDVDDVAQALNVPKSWVYSHKASGDLPFVMVGRYVRFKPREIVAWLEGTAHAA